MPSTYIEFLNENSHRRYPLTDACAAVCDNSLFQMPDAVMVDMRLYSPIGGKTGGVFYMSAVLIRSDSMDIELSYKPTTGTAFPIGSFRNIALSGAFTEYPLSPSTDAVGEFANIFGIVMVGAPTVASASLGKWTFSDTAAPINTVAIVEVPATIRYIRVGGQSFTDKIVLREGANVTLTPTISPDGTQSIITIAATPTTNGSANPTLNNTGDVMDELVRRYGPPVLTVNGAVPDDKGAINLTPGDCITAEATGNLLKLSNPCGQPCCSDNSMQDAMTGINTLNQNIGKLSGFYTAVLQAMTQMDTKLKEIEIQSREF